MKNPRPTIFVGSSTEGLQIAEAIQLNLDHACEVTLWSQGVFGLGQGTLESLVERLPGFDFAILVLTADDVIISRKKVAQTARDNVLIELGLCVGALGRRRTFIVYDRDASLKLPSDLAGVTAATFQIHADGNLRSSVGAATSVIKVSIQEQGKRSEKISANVDENMQFQIIHDLLDNSLEQFLIWMYEHNRSIKRQPRFFGTSIRYEYSLRNGSAGNGGFSMEDLCNRLPDAGLLQMNLREEVSLTDRGKQFAQWLLDNGHKADYFRSDVGGWGERPVDMGMPFPRGYWPQQRAATTEPIPGHAPQAKTDEKEPAKSTLYDEQGKVQEKPHKANEGTKRTKKRPK